MDYTYWLKPENLEIVGRYDGVVKTGLGIYQPDNYTHKCNVMFKDGKRM